jgi:AraC-like DNA-binding protein
MNTIARHGAEKGGLAPLVLHTISERFAVAIERCKDTGELRVLCRRMLLAYCDAVRAFGIGIRSAPIFRATRHILDHLDCPLRLEELAAIAKLSPAYLCRRFKRETGITISEFIRQKRVAVAKWHLGRSDRTITEIGAELGYEDANYFSRTFSRDTGLSPSEYRRRRWQTDFDGLPDA